MALSLSLRSGGSKQVDALETLETEVRSFAASVRATGLLSMATGSTTMDAWVAVPDDAERPRTPGHEHVTMGVGSPASGRIGFVRSHRESQRALEILHMAESGRLDPVTYYDQVRLISLLAKDLPAAGAFVVSTLGRLAGTDERSHELRETLFAFLQANRSYTAVAHSSHLHKNTVIQRVMKASELAGRDMTKHIDVHVALMLVRVLGDRVLDSS
jgi:sugar diacid utilization regulator